MNTVQLECFVSVAEYLNFSRASEALRISQPSVSYQIQTLEDELGVKLFSRTSKSVELTAEGIRFLPDAISILKTLLSAKERLNKHEHLILFDVGCHDHTELRILPEVFKELSSEFPNLRPSVRMIPFPSVLELVAERKLHAAFQIKERQRNPSLSFKELYKPLVSCVCSPDSPLAKCKTLTPDDLRGNLISCSPRHIPGAVFDMQSKVISQLEATQQYYTENIESAFTLVKANLGYTLCPDIPQLRDPELSYIPVTGAPQLSFGIYYRRNDRSPIIKKFLEICMKICGEE